MMHDQSTGEVCENSYLTQRNRNIEANNAYIREHLGEVVGALNLQGGARGSRKSNTTSKKTSQNLSCLPKRRSSRLVGKNLVKMVDSDSNRSDGSEKSSDTQYDVSDNDELQCGGPEIKKGTQSKHKYYVDPRTGKVSILTPLPKGSYPDADDSRVERSSGQTLMRQCSRTAKKQWLESTIERCKMGMKKGAIAIWNCDVDSGDENRARWGDDLRAVCMGKLDPSIREIRKQDPGVLLHVYAIMENDWEYIGGTFSMKKFRTHCSTVMKGQRSRLHKHFQASGQCLDKKPPENVKPEHWKALCEWWLSPDGLESIDKMKYARSRVKHPSTVGRGGYRGKEIEYKRKRGHIPNLSDLCPDREEKVRGESVKSASTVTVTPFCRRNSTTPVSKTSTVDIEERDNRLCDRITDSINTAFTVGLERLITSLVNRPQMQPNMTDMKQSNIAPERGVGPSSLPKPVSSVAKSLSGRSTSIKLDFVDLTKEGGKTIDLNDDAHYDYTDSVVVKQEVLDTREAAEVVFSSPQATQEKGKGQKNDVEELTEALTLEPVPKKSNLDLSTSEQAITFEVSKSTSSPCVLKFKVGDMVKLKSPVDQQVVAIARIEGVWGVDRYYDNPVPIGQLMVTAISVLNPDAPLLEREHPEGLVSLKHVKEHSFLWRQKCMRK